MSKEKQIIKIGKKSKIFLIALSSILLYGMVTEHVLASPASDAYGQYCDSRYSFATQTLPKTTTSSVYIEHIGDCTAYVEVRSNGINYTIGGNYVVPAGTCRYMANSVVENGNYTCYLMLNPAASGNRFMKGNWQADTNVF